MPIIAEGVTPPPGMASWLACLAFMLVMLNQGVKLLGSFRGKPSTPELQNEVRATYTTLSDFEKFRSATEQRIAELETSTEERDRSLRAELASMERRLNESAQKRLDAFNERLLEQLKAVSRIEGHLDAQSSA